MLPNLILGLGQQNSFKFKVNLGYIVYFSPVCCNKTPEQISEMFSEINFKEIGEFFLFQKVTFSIPVLAFLVHMWRLQDICPVGSECQSSALPPDHLPASHLAQVCLLCPLVIYCELCLDGLTVAVTSLAQATICLRHFSCMCYTDVLSTVFLYEVCVRYP